MSRWTTNSLSLSVICENPNQTSTSGENAVASNIRVFMNIQKWLRICIEISQTKWVFGTNSFFRKKMSKSTPAWWYCLDEGAATAKCNKQINKQTASPLGFDHGFWENSKLNRQLIWHVRSLLIFSTSAESVWPTVSLAVVLQASDILSTQYSVLWMFL